MSGGLTGGTGLPTRGRSAKARWKEAAELACVRWVLRVERLLALTSWRLEDYRRAAAWVVGRRGEEPVRGISPTGLADALKQRHEGGS